MYPAELQSLHDRVLHGLATKSLKYSKQGFTLRSGKTSHVLIDASRTIKSGEHFEDIGYLCERFLHSLTDHWPVAVGGPATGCDPLCAALLATTSVRLDWFSVRKEPKNRGLDYGCLSGAYPTSGESVVLFEDVLTTGGSLLHAIEQCRPKMDILGVFVLVDREIRCK
jgi:orotate phosphoribosyltransferase